MPLIDKSDGCAFFDQTVSPSLKLKTYKTSDDVCTRIYLEVISAGDKT